MYKQKQEIMRKLLKTILTITILLLSINLTSQNIGVTIDPSVLANEGNVNARVTFDDGVYGDSRTRILTSLEYLSGHAYLSGFIGLGYDFDYTLLGIELQTQPGAEIGIIYRYEWEHTIRWNPSHAFNLRQAIKLSEKLDLYMVARLIDRTDLKAQNNNTLTPESLKRYNKDFAIGVKFNLN